MALINSSRSRDANGRLGYGGRLKDFARPYSENDGKIVGSADVVKVGRSTGYTEGYVADLHAVVEVPFGNGKAVFIDQLGVCPGKDNCGVFSTGGDSGAALV